MVGRRSRSLRNLRIPLMMINTPPEERCECILLSAAYLTVVVSTCIMRCLEVWRGEVISDAVFTPCPRKDHRQLIRGGRILSLSSRDLIKFHEDTILGGKIAQMTFRFGFKVRGLVKWLDNQN